MQRHGADTPCMHGAPNVHLAEACGGTVRPALGVAPCLMYRTRVHCIAHAAPPGAAQVNMELALAGTPQIALYRTRPALRQSRGPTEPPG